MEFTYLQKPISANQRNRMLCDFKHSMGVLNNQNNDQLTRYQPGYHRRFIWSHVNNCNVSGFCALLDFRAFSSAMIVSQLGRFTHMHWTSYHFRTIRLSRVKRVPAQCTVWKCYITWLNFFPTSVWNSWCVTGHILTNTSMVQMAVENC